MRLPHCQRLTHVNVLTDATTAVRHELKASEDFSRLMLAALKASLSRLEGQRAEEAAAEAAGATPRPGAAPGCGELLRPADRHALGLVTSELIVRSMSY